MPKTTGTATEFVLKLLRDHPDYEMQISDIFEEADQLWTKANIANTMARLHAKGLISKVAEENRTVWWTIAG